MLIPSSFAVHVTYTCPLACAHCCFSSNPSNKDRLAIEQIKATIEQLDRSTIKMVAFTGGEPFLLGKGLVAIVKCAADCGFVVRIVTSGYFGKSPETAKLRLAELKVAGLNELSISWDDFHEEFVKFSCIFNVFWASKELAITTAINIVQGAESKWTKIRVSTELGLPANSEDIICESPLNKTGNAYRELSDVEIRPERLIGPCPYIMTGPTLSAKQKLLACCGVIPNTDALVLDDVFAPERLNESIQKGLRSPLYNWLYLRGPYAIMDWISKKYGISIPPKSEIGGNCEACSYLFNTENLANKVELAANERKEEIFSELFLMESLGLSDPKSLQSLWAEVIPTRDTSANSMINRKIIPIAARI